jgi:hypothetical protein
MTIAKPTNYTVHLHYSTLFISSIYPEESIWRLFPFIPSPLFYKEVGITKNPTNVGLDSKTLLII